MCMTTKEMNDTMAAYQEWKRVKEEAEANMEALKLKAIEFLNETESCEAVDKKGNPSADSSVSCSRLHIHRRNGRTWTRRQ